MHTWRRALWVGGLALLMAGIAQPLYADHERPAAEQETGALVVTKLFRGIANAATGWMEIPKQVSLTWQQQGAGRGVSWGLIKGLSYALARSMGGAYEIVTFPLPIPEEYKPLMQPEYVLSDLPGGGEPR